MKDPLSVYLRPQNLDEIMGQSHLKQAHHPLMKMVNSCRLKSLLLYGPPGTGKTTLAKILAASCNLPFVEMNATVDKTKEIRDAIEGNPVPFVLFLDEIHHLNKRFQNILLSYMESGQVICIGTTTENPYRVINDGIRSRMFLIPLFAPKAFEIKPLFNRVRQCYPDIILSQEAEDFLLENYNSDVRHFIQVLELLFQTADNGEITIKDIEGILERKHGDNPRQLMSAYIKSMRGSDQDAALYYLSRMIVIGVPGTQILRRMVIFCSEDVGLAKLEALQIIESVSHSYNRIGSEDRDSFLVLAQATIYLALVPKSRSVVDAVQRVMRLVESPTALPAVPKYLLNNYEGSSIPGSPEAPYLPRGIGPFYNPSNSGGEVRIAEFLANKHK